MQDGFSEPEGSLKPAAQDTMGAEVSGSLRRTPSRSPRSALGLDGVGAPRLAPAARLVSRVRAERDPAKTC